MKKFLIILFILLTLSCTNITVLEVKRVDDYYNVIFSRVDIETVHEQRFYTTLGVNNFLTEVADKDLSGWRVK